MIEAHKIFSQFDTILACE